MWVLSNINQKENVYYLTCGPSLNVSRDGPGYIILPDKTISKAHASFSLAYNDKNLSYPEKLPEVILCDLKSTNGTYLLSGTADFVKLTPNEPVTLKHGDLVKFGRTKTFRIEYEPLVVTSSLIAIKQTKEKLKECIKCLGAHLVKEWISSCSLLVMNDLVLTTKTVCALAAGVNITTPEYLADMVSAIKEKKSLPDVKNYIPVLKEPSLNSAEVSFLPDPKRRKIFSGKSFYFQNEISFKKMKNSVEEAGGTALILSETNFKEVILENSIYIKSVEKDVTKLITSSLELFKSSGLYPIPESDIGLAVVYCSTEKYCNPKFRISGILRPSTNQSQISQSLYVLATETQQQTGDMNSSPVSRTTIPETGESSKSRNSVNSRNPVATSIMNSLEGNIVSKFNKENIGKRKRSVNESSPELKIDEPKGKRKNQTSLEITLDDEVDNISHFNPKHCSTEKMSQDATSHKRKADYFAIPETNSVKKAVRMSTGQSTTLESHQESLDTSCIPKSIPFDPYTLPSIQIENFPSIDPTMEEAGEDVETQHFLDTSIVKEEPKSKDPPQFRTNQDPQINTKVIPKVIGETTSTTTATTTPTTTTTTTINTSTRAATNRDMKIVLKEECEDFARPSTPQRKRKPRTTSNEADMESISKRVKVKKITPEPVVVKRSPSEDHMEPAQNNSSGMKDTKRSSSDYLTDKDQLNTSAAIEFEDKRNQPFISTGIIKKKPNDEISKLDQTLEKSLIVVEVVSLVKIMNIKENFPVSPNGLPNFKKFKKVLPYNSSLDNDVMPVLPQILGGADLVCHSDASSRKESFIASQPDLQEHLEVRETESRDKTSSDDPFDTDFGFSSTRSKKKGRW